MIQKTIREVKEILGDSFVGYAAPRPFPGDYWVIFYDSDKITWERYDEATDLCNAYVDEPLILLFEC